MAKIARSDFLRLISESIYTRIDNWEHSHREGECIIHLKPVDELQLSLSLHVPGSISTCIVNYNTTLPIQVRTVTDIRVHQIDVRDESGVIESHEYRTHPHRYDECQEAVEALFLIAVEPERYLKCFLAKYTEPGGTR